MVGASDLLRWWKHEEGTLVNAVETHPILLCYDGSPGAKHAIEEAGALFPGHEVVVLHVWSPIALVLSRYGGVTTPPTFDDQEIRQAAIAARRARERRCPSRRPRRDE